MTIHINGLACLSSILIVALLLVIGYGYEYNCDQMDDNKYYKNFLFIIRVLIPFGLFPFLGKSFEEKMMLKIEQESQNPEENILEKEYEVGAATGQYLFKKEETSV